MLLTGLNTADSFAQLLTLLVVFVLVLALTLYTTRWIARYQKGQKTGRNIDIVETCPVGNGKYIQIIRIADKYVAIAVCKDQVTLLAELPKEQIEFPDINGESKLHFGELLGKAKSIYQGKSESEVNEKDKSKEE